MFSPDTLHSNFVPVATDVTDGVGNPLGSHPVALTTTAATVSATSRFVTVAPPLFVTTIWYVTGEPISRLLAGFWNFVTCRLSTGGRTVKPTGLLIISVVLGGTHAFAATTYAVSDTSVGKHTSLTVPVIVNV
jgi:hypothetical protein